MIMADQLRAPCPLRLVCGDEHGGVNFKHRRGRIGYIGAGLHRVDAIRRLKANSSGKRECVVVMHERNGMSLAFVVRSEGDAVPFVRDHVATLSTIYADEGSGWDALHAGWQTHRVNHSVAFMDNGVCTNQAESYFSRLRRAEVGTHHHIAGSHLGGYAREMVWREDHRRRSNGAQAGLLCGAVMGGAVSRKWAGYWQRAA